MARVPEHFRGSSCRTSVSDCSLGSPVMLQGCRKFSFQFHFKLVTEVLVIIKCCNNKAHSNTIYAKI